MSMQRILWLIFPVVLIAMGLWLIAVRTSPSKIPVGIILMLCILGCVRQVFLFWTKGQKVHASIAFAAAVIGILAGLISFFHFI